MAGDDYLEGLEGKDTLEGGDGNDTLYGNTVDTDADAIDTEDAAGDVLYGGKGEDLLWGRLDTTQGGTAHDTLIGGEGADTILGGIASYDGSAAVTIILDDGSAEEGGHAEGDVLRNDPLIGDGSEVNYVIGSSRNDWLRGDTGNNTLEGGDGNDTLIGVGGTDVLDGGDGTDTASYNLFTDSDPPGSRIGSVDVGLGEPDTQGVQITGTGDTLRNIENLIGSWGNDTLNGNSGANKIEGIQGNDLIEGMAGGDVLDGGEHTAVSVTFDLGGAETYPIAGGGDALSYANSPDGVRVSLPSSASGGHASGDRISNFEHVIGSSKDDTLTGDNEANQLVGRAGKDSLRGGGGDDTLDGGDGDDTLDGGDGDDMLTGGDGADTFRFGDGDTVSDFGSGDKIDVSGLRGLTTTTPDDANDPANFASNYWLRYINVNGGVIEYDPDGNFDPTDGSTGRLGTAVADEDERTMTASGVSEDADLFDFS